ncbi:MAG TPA: FHA domain-containing protein [Polyangiaceae bacterium]|nr:FHA domain-containing protein [Polyangiaceae bacterium]
MALTVIVRSGDLAAPASITFDAPRIVIGRGEGCEVRLPDPSVSHRHASIRQRGTDYVVIDEGSTNGTFAGPVRLSPQAPRMLRSGDLLRIGRIWLEVRIAQAQVTQAQMLATREIALSLVASALAAGGEPPCPEVRVTSGPDRAGILLLKETERVYVVGRGPTADLSIEDEDLSRRHLEIVRRGGQLMVRDLGSKNGSELEGVPLKAGHEVAWLPGKRLSLGQSVLACQDPVRAALDEIESAPDERMSPTDGIDPPALAVEVDAVPAMEPSAGEPALAPVVARTASVAAKRSALGVFDLLVALVAFAVLGLSLFGLWLLFRS